jgi:hypothetical protein
LEYREDRSRRDRDRAGAGAAICPRDFDANPRIDGVKPGGAID